MPIGFPTYDRTNLVEVDKLMAKKVEDLTPEDFNDLTTS